MYVDCLFVQQEGFHRPSDFAPLMNTIEEKTGIPIALEGVFKWVAFLASKRDARIPVPNQYFGAFQDGTLKYRGIELRRRDTTTWVKRIQLKSLEILAQADTPQEFADYVPEVMKFVEHAKRELRLGRVPMEELIVHQRLSRAIEAYRTPSPAARAARQLQARGWQFAPGQLLEFLFARNGDGVHAWEISKVINFGRLDLKKYCGLLDRAMLTILNPGYRIIMGVDETLKLF
jgi:DNA polymerase-2